MKVKICGISSIEIAKKICILRPDSIGVYIDPEMGKNFTDKETAKEIIKIAREYSIETFFLTCLQDAASIIEISSSLNSSHIQMTSKTKAEIAVHAIEKIKAALPSVQLIKVIGVVGEESKLLSKKYDDSSSVDQLLLDSKVGNLPGGTGIAHDWNISKEIVNASTKPVWFAGGIRLHTVQDAIDLVHPYGVDVETGVQNPDGSKNYETIKEFIALVHKS